jgi:hypothetical protein
MSWFNRFAKEAARLSSHYTAFGVAGALILAYR